MGKIARFAAISCTHFPGVDEDSAEWVIEQCQAFKPSHVIHLGDCFDYDGIGRWEGTGDHTLGDEYESGGKFLYRLRRATESAEHIFMEGNHEQRLHKPGNVPAKYRDLLDYRLHVKELSPELGRWKRFPYVYNYDSGVFRLGQVAFAHGYSAADSGLARQAVNLADEHGLLVSGHTHRPHGLQEVVLSQAATHRWIINPGCLIKMDPIPEYMRINSSKRWGHGMVIGEVDTTTRAKGCNWSTELLVRKMAWGTSTPWRGDIAA